MSRAGEGVLLSPRRDISRFPELRVSNQNAVDIERIRLGLDVRTTPIDIIDVSARPDEI
ncbi:hypothetical protein APSETT444_006592 [Aspergillus pseudonomiae]